MRRLHADRGDNPDPGIGHQSTAAKTSLTSDARLDNKPNSIRRPAANEHSSVELIDENGGGPGGPATKAAAKDGAGFAVRREIEAGTAIIRDAELRNESDSLGGLLNSTTLKAYTGRSFSSGTKPRAAALSKNEVSASNMLLASSCVPHLRDRTIVASTVRSACRRLVRLATWKTSAE